MNRFTTRLIGACIALAASGAYAQDTMKNDTMPKDGMMKKEMTMCSDMMKKGNAASTPMKK